MQNKIRQVRKIKSISQIYVAKCLGISQTEYSNIENGKSKITPEILQQIAIALDVTPQVIIKFNTQAVLQAYLKAKSNPKPIKK